MTEHKLVFILKEITIKILNLAPNEFPQLLNALSLEGWYLQNVHLESLYKEFKDDFFCIHNENKIIAFIVAIKYTNEFGFVSNFVVSKEFRELGFGTKLFEHALYHLQGCQIALDCQRSNESFYKKYGFSTYYDSVYYLYEKQEIKNSIFNGITNIVDAKSLNIYNKELLSQSFANHIQSIATHKDTEFRAIYNENKISSYSLATKYLDGYKLVIASQSYEEIKEIFFALIHIYPLKTKIYLEVTKVDFFLVKLCQLLNMKEFSRKSRMYNKVL